MAQSPPSPDPYPDVDSRQQTALLDTTLTRIIQYAQLMKAGLHRGELDTSHADQLGQSVLLVLKKAAVLADRAERAARAVKPPVDEAA